MEYLFEQFRVEQDWDQRSTESVLLGYIIQCAERGRVPHVADFRGYLIKFVLCDNL